MEEHGINIALNYTIEYSISSDELLRVSSWPEELQDELGTFLEQNNIPLLPSYIKTDNLDMRESDFLANMDKFMNDNAVIVNNILVINYIPTNVESFLFWYIMQESDKIVIHIIINDNSVRLIALGILDRIIYMNNTHYGNSLDCSWIDQYRYSSTLAGSTMIMRMFSDSYGYPQYVTMTDRILPSREKRIQLDPELFNIRPISAELELLDYYSPHINPYRTYNHARITIEYEHPIITGNNGLSMYQLLYIDNLIIILLNGAYEERQPKTIMLVDVVVLTQKLWDKIVPPLIEQFRLYEQELPMDERMFNLFHEFDNEWRDYQSDNYIDLGDDWIDDIFPLIIDIFSPDRVYWLLVIMPPELLEYIDDLN